MDKAGIAEMPEHRNVPVQQLQDQIFHALQSATRGRVGRIARKLLELVVDPADRTIDPALDGRMGMTQQDRWHIFLVEDDRLVAHLDNSGDAEADVARLVELPQFKAES